MKKILLLILICVVLLAGCDVNTNDPNKTEPSTSPTTSAVQNPDPNPDPDDDNNDNSEVAHDYLAVITEPTCTTDGYTTYTCKTCDHSYTSENLLMPRN